MYVTYWNPPVAHQITFEQMLAGVDSVLDLNALSFGNDTRTKTICVNELTKTLKEKTNIPRMIAKLREFNERHSNYQNGNLASHYKHFSIPKKSGGFRPIDAPDDGLKLALTELRILLNSFMIASYHNAAYAYIPNRCFVDAVKCHQFGRKRYRTNPETGKQEVVTFENNWAVKFDFHGFFPSTNFNFVFGTFNLIYPFALIMEDESGKEELRKALSMCFLNDSLPQGTPISPWITNVMMIPFDHLMTRKLSKYTAANGITYEFTYTRYADDITISSYLSFDWQEIQNVVINCLNFIHAPFSLNESKTHYGNRHSSKNWTLGLMWNKHNEITVGWRNIKNFKAMCCNYIMANKAGNKWDLEDVQKFNGTLNYYYMVEPEVIKEIITKYNTKFGVNLKRMIHEDLAR